MKVRLHFKTPDVAEYALEDLDEDERYEAEAAIERYVEYGELAIIEIDSESGVARVLPQKEDRNARNFKTVLDLSTAHVPNPKPDFGDVRVEAHEYGWIVWVTDITDEGADWLKPILAEARKRECVLVLFDQDAEKFDGLKTYDW